MPRPIKTVSPILSDDEKIVISNLDARGPLVLPSKSRLFSHVKEFLFLHQFLLTPTLFTRHTNQRIWYVNVSDQTAFFTHKTKTLISILLKCFLAFNVLNMTKTAGWIQNFKKRDVIALKRQFLFFCTIVTTCVLQMGQMEPKNDPEHPDNEWGWLSRRLGDPQWLK